MFCTLIGLFVIIPWYGIRLLQWNRLASEYPILVDPAAPAGSLSDKFRRTKKKLIMGMVGGVIAFLFIGTLFTVLRNA